VSRVSFRAPFIFSHGFSHDLLEFAQNRFADTTSRFANANAFGIYSLLEKIYFAHLRGLHVREGPLGPTTSTAERL
jgi:hypothetical protein